MMQTPRFFAALALFAATFFAACSAFKTATPKSGEASTSAMQLRNKITDYAQRYVGSGYKYAGTSPSTGFDCSGFTSYVLKEFKVKVSPASSVQATEGRPIALERVLPGDLIFFGESSKKISHVALVLKRSKDGIVCVHSTTSRGVIVENVSTSTYWKPKILFARDVITR
jgi:cell wall-associated NlpC family hydrolase